MLRTGTPARYTGTRATFPAATTPSTRQFEFVQQTWITSPKFAHLPDNKDPIVSDPRLLDPAEGGSTESVMTIPAEPVRQRLQRLKCFVTVQGSGCFLMPAMQALCYLATRPVTAAPAKPGSTSPMTAAPTSHDPPPRSHLC